MENIDRKVQSVRRIEDYNEKKKYETNKQIFKGYMKSLSQKSDRALLKVGKIAVPFSLVSLATVASGSFLGVHNHDITIHEAIEMLGKTGAVELGAMLGIVVSTIAAISAKDAIQFAHDSMTYPKNKEQLQKLGLYNKMMDVKENLIIQTNEKSSSEKGASK